LALITSQKSPAAVEEWRKQRVAAARSAKAGEVEKPKLTGKAWMLAESMGMSPDDLPSGRMLHEADILAMASARPQFAALLPESLRRVAIFGASQGGMALAEIVRAAGYTLAAFLDDDPKRAGTRCEGVPVRPGADMALLAAEGIGAMATQIALGPVRLALRDRAQAAGLVMINVVHPRATIASNARLGVGNVIKAGAILDAHVCIGDCCVIEDAVVLPHNNVIGDGCLLAPGACFGGDCNVGSLAVVGTGSVISARLRIGAGAIIATGSVVVRDVPEGAVVEGSPARVTGTAAAKHG
jgi:sugar O-acyltransferase (sialic acid O-acetyltransferase NeuD family)